MYAKPNPKKVAWQQREAARKQQVETCYEQYLTPQERAARQRARLGARV